MGQLRARSAEAKAGRRRHILDCAAALCARSGYDELAVADVAERAGLAKGTIFRYFPTKEDLGRALAEAHLARWSDDLERRLGRLNGPPAPDAAARLLVESLAGRRDLLVLAARGLLPADAFDDLPAARALDAVLPYLGDDGGARLMRTALAAAAGLRATLGDDDLPGELHHALRTHLAGMRTASLRATV
ncbi:MAG TPA: helix-turn-helix domain-containing protein [Gaiellales bacterium]|nr:helix-turn-helix domain-containing protein [Gaiellales bacterium]